MRSVRALQFFLLISYLRLTIITWTSNQSLIFIWLLSFPVVMALYLIYVRPIEKFKYRRLFHAWHYKVSTIDSNWQLLYTPLFLIRRFLIASLPFWVGHIRWLELQLLVSLNFSFAVYYIS